jgi:hypothetical protein
MRERENTLQIIKYFNRMCHINHCYYCRELVVFAILFAKFSSTK